MKKMFVNFKSLGFVALAAAALTFSSCTKNCEETRDINFGSAACDEAATVGAFVGTWKVDITGSSDSYTLEITKASTEYALIVKSSFGLFVNNAEVSPVTVTFDVTQNKATYAGEITSPETSSEVSDVTLTVNGSDIVVNGKFDGDSFTDSGAKL